MVDDAMLEAIEKWQALTDKLIEASREVLNRGVIPPENLT